uniref:Flavonoid 3'-hydroxylase n=1 Tax=Pohlia nutans TaxID=140635 RepID=W5XK09_9BRYO|nr:flavonoid 3'-hydroxylase [Pohlia nutans]
MESLFDKIMAKDELVFYGIPVFFGLVLVLLFLFVDRVGKKQKKLPPGPFPWPVFGNLFLGGPHPHQVFTQLAKQYGNIMSLFFGNVRVVILSDPTIAKEFFTVRDASFASRPIHDLMYTQAKYMNYGKENVSMTISTYAPQVREMRQLCISELFTPQRLETKRTTRMEELQRMIQGTAQSGPVEIRPLLSEFSLRLNCRATFNKAFLHSEGIPSSGLDPQAFRRLETENTKLLATHNIADIVPAIKFLLGRLDLEGIHARWKDVTERKVSCAEAILDWYRKHGDGEAQSETDFVETLLHLTEDGKYTTTTAQAVIFELLTAGTDTVAASMEWALLEMALHPQCQAKLHAEIDAQFGMLGPVQEEEAAQLPYLQAVVKEVLRLHATTAMGIPHSNVEDATLGGYHIPAGTTVMPNLWALHRDPMTWGDDALAFNPDRFLASDLSVNGTNYQYLPFGAGRRICPGRAMAMRVLSVTLATFVHAFDMSGLPGVELNANEGVTGLNIRPETPLLLQMSLRPAASLYVTLKTSTSNGHA